MAACPDRGPRGGESLIVGSEEGIVTEKGRGDEGRSTDFGARKRGTSRKKTMNT